MRFAIVGAGTLGMTLGYRLAQAGHHVAVFESAEQEGGLATWFDYGDFVWDRFYHVILRQDERLLALIGELGLADRMQWRETKTGFLWNGRLVSMSSNWEFLKFPVLSLPDKARLALGILYAQRIDDPEPLERVTAKDWLTRVFGRRVFQRIWEPLLASKFGELRDQVPATIIWATIRRYYKTRNKGDGKETLGFLSGGLRPFYGALRERIEKHGGSIETGARVESIVLDDRGGVSVRVGGGSKTFDRVVSTVPASVFARLAPDMQVARAVNAPKPRFLGVVCLSLVLNRRLSQFYVTNLIERGLPFTGIIEVTALTGSREMSGRHLVMLPRYDVPESVWFTRPEAEIAEEFLAALRKTWPDIDESIVSYHVQRAPHVQALWIDQPPAEHAPISMGGGKVWSVNAELAGRDTLNNNAIIKVAEQAAEALLAGAGTDARAGGEPLSQPAAR